METIPPTWGISLTLKSNQPTQVSQLPPLFLRFCTAVSESKQLFSAIFCFTEFHPREKGFTEVNLSVALGTSAMYNEKRTIHNTKKFS